MADDTGEPGPLGDLILRRTLEELDRNPDFDDEALHEIDRLVGERQLSSFEAVVRALSNRGEQ